MNPLSYLHVLADSCFVDASGNSYCTGLPTAGASSGNLQHLVQIVLGTLAAVAVLIIVIAGLKFITAQGDPQGTTRARETIIYALVGLAIAVLAEVIVTFVIGKF